MPPPNVVTATLWIMLSLTVPKGKAQSKLLRLHWIGTHCKKHVLDVTLIHLLVRLYIKSGRHLSLCLSPAPSVSSFFVNSPVINWRLFPPWAHGFSASYTSPPMNHAWTFAHWLPLLPYKRVMTSMISLLLETGPPLCYLNNITVENISLAKILQSLFSQFPIKDLLSPPLVMTFVHHFYVPLNKPIRWLKHIIYSCVCPL